MATALQTEAKSFGFDLARNQMFLTMEGRIKNPAHPRSRPRSETLLSAYVVLSCGRFESFLRTSFHSAATALGAKVTGSRDPKIPSVDRFHWHNLDGFVKWASKAKGVDRPEMIGKIEAFAASISAGKIHPASFESTDANPNPETVKKMFNRFGIDDPFQRLSVSYIDSLGRSFNKNLIEQRLSQFVKRRNEAAHHGRIAGASRTDIADDHVFMLALGKSIVDTLDAYVANI